MAITGISAPVNVVSGSGSGPKVREAKIGVFQQVLDRLQNLAGISPGASSDSGTAEVGTLRDQTTQFKTAFQRKLIQRLLERGVDLSQPFTLKSDGFGGVDVSGSHPDRDAIEQLFEEDSELRGEFAELAGQAERLYLKDRSEFTTGDQPETGYIDSSRSTQPGFNLIVRDGQTEMAFLR